MGLNTADKLGKVIGNLAREQSILADNISPDDPNQSLLVGVNENIIVAGKLIVNQYTYPTDSFIIDHPVYGDIDSAVLNIDGGYASETPTELLVRNY